MLLGVFASCAAHAHRGALRGWGHRDAVLLDGLDLGLRASGASGDEFVELGAARKGGTRRRERRERGESAKPYLD